jgi:hypothetical protein
MTQEDIDGFNLYVTSACGKHPNPKSSWYEWMQHTNYTTILDRYKAEYLKAVMKKKVQTEEDKLIATGIYVVYDDVKPAYIAKPAPWLGTSVSPKKPPRIINAKKEQSAS